MNDSLADNMQLTAIFSFYLVYFKASWADLLTDR